MPRGTSTAALGWLLAEKSADTIETRPRAVENSEVVVDGVHFLIVHKRDADIPSIQAAGREGIHHERALRELHGGR